MTRQPSCPKNDIPLAYERKARICKKAFTCGDFEASVRLDQNASMINNWYLLMRSILELTFFNTLYLAKKYNKRKLALASKKEDNNGQNPSCRGKGV